MSGTAGLRPCAVSCRWDRRVKTLLAAVVALGATLAAAPPAVAAEAGADDLRMNQVQVVGTHNSYKRELSGAELAEQRRIRPDNADIGYSHATVSDQLAGQGVRGLELDLFPDPDGGAYAHPLVRRNAGLPPLAGMDRPGVKVLHVADLDHHGTCPTLRECLTEVREFSAAHPDHVPIPIMLELKSSDDALEALGGVVSLPWDRTQLDALDAEIRAVFADDQMITPDDLIVQGRTLEESVLSAGWPTLDDARGQVLFLMDNDPGPIRDAYREGRPDLAGAVLFTNSLPGEADAAFVKRNDPIAQGAEIRELVERGYYVRTRSDVPIDTVVSGDTAMRDAALASGAQLVSTDFPVPGMAARYDSDFVASLPGGAVVRCNPVNADAGCGADE